MVTSPSNYSKKEFDELKIAFEALYKKFINMAKKNMKLKDSLKKVTLDKETLEKRMMPMKNQSTSLQEEKMISISLKEELARQN